MTFLDLKKVYNHVDRKILQKVLQMYGEDGNLRNDTKSFYVNSNNNSK